MKLISEILHKINYLRLSLLLIFEPHIRTYAHLKVWATLYRKTDLSYIVNYFEQYLKHGLIWRNTLFRDRLVRERYNREPYKVG